MEWLKGFIASLSSMSPNVLGSVIGGIIVVLFVDLIRNTSLYFTRWRFKHVFGEDILCESSFHLVYAVLDLMQQKGSKRTYAYIKPGEEESGTFFSAKRQLVVVTSEQLSISQRL